MLSPQDQAFRFRLEKRVGEGGLNMTTTHSACPSKSSKADFKIYADMDMWNLQTAFEALCIKSKIIKIGRGIPKGPVNECL